MIDKNEVEQTILAAMESCADSCLRTSRIDFAVKLGQTCKELAEAYVYLKSIKEDE